VRLLDRIQSPSDVKKLSPDALRLLGEEIRDKIIEVVAANGGHLAPNLGVVELTLALHRVFDAPRDKIIWDVGHQTYVHKLITGRQDRFETLRCLGGISGFPRLTESPYDAFGTGHSSTSISAAVGYAQARDLRGEDYAVAAVIGDGSISAGMAYEALNHAGSCKSDIMVVLNDNEMSIAQNVGAMSSHLNRLRTAPSYNRKKKEIEELLHKIPKVGEPLASLASKVKNSLKYFLVAGVLFEELGFTYLGPANGHDVEGLEELFRRARQKGGPVLVHVITDKGKGYRPAEEHPEIFHGVGAFDRATGQFKKSRGAPTYTQVFGSTITRLAERDERIVALTAAMGSGTGLDDFSRRFPRRFFDVGIAEQHAVTCAAGMALGGLKPIVSIYSTFCQRAYDQIAHDVCLQNIPVVFAVDRAGLVGEDGCTHHGIFDIAFFRAIPNLPILAAGDENELQHMLYTALHMEGPVVVRYPRGAGLGVPLDAEFKLLDVGKAELKRPGRDVTIIGFGPVVRLCELAAAELQGQGIDAAVVNLRFLNPLDREMIVAQARATGRLVTVEDHSLNGGMGSAVAEVLADECLDQVRLGRIGYRTFVEHGPVSALQQEAGLSIESIRAMAAAICTEEWGSAGG